IGSFIFFMMGVIQPVGVFFSTLPLSIGSAVLFVAYLQMFTSSIEFLKDITVNTMNVYRVAIPIFVGAIIITFPASYFESLPAQLRPFLSNGLLVGIVLSLVLENIVDHRHRPALRGCRRGHPDRPEPDDRGPDPRRRR